MQYYKDLIDSLGIYILRHILFDLCDLITIKRCWRASKKFHILTNKQLEIVKDANMGMDYCIEKNLIDTIKWLYYKDPDHLIYVSFSYNFIRCCEKNRLEMCKFFYQIMKKEIDGLLENPWATVKWFDLFNTSVNNPEMFKWLCSLDKIKLTMKQKSYLINKSSNNEIKKYISQL